VELEDRCFRRASGAAEAAAGGWQGVDEDRDEKQALPESSVRGPSAPRSSGARAGMSQADAVAKPILSKTV
jgi:hypothetical protein